MLSFLYVPQTKTWNHDQSLVVHRRKKHVISCLFVFLILHFYWKKIREFTAGGTPPARLLLAAFALPRQRTLKALCIAHPASVVGFGCTPHVHHTTGSVGMSPPWPDEDCKEVHSVKISAKGNSRPLSVAFVAGTLERWTPEWFPGEQVRPCHWPFVRVTLEFGSSPGLRADTCDPVIAAILG